MKKQLIIFFLVCCSLNYLQAQTASSSHLETQSTIKGLQNRLWVLKDSGKYETIAKVIKAEPDLWQFATADLLDPGLAGRLWLHLQIENTTGQEQSFFLESANPWIDYLTIYQVQSELEIKSKRVGDMVPFSARQIQHRNLVFPIKIGARQKLDIYLDYKSRGSINVPLTLYSNDDFRTKVLIEYSLLGIFFGILIAVLIYNITLFVHDPNRGFLYYILYLIVIILLYLITTGCIGHLTRLNYGWWVNELMLILASMGNILILFFTRKFFNTKSRMKILNIAIIILVGALLAAMLFILFDYHNGVLLSYALGLAGILINLIVGYRAVQLKLPQAWLYLMAWSFLFTGLILESLAVSTLINSRWLAHYALQSGTIMEVLCFSLAIGFRVRNLIIEHESSIRQLNIVSRDLDLARRIQKRILPDGPPLAYTGNIQVYYEPLHAVGGDFYSFAEVAESQLGILVADVSGHGVAAALDSSTVKIAFDHARLQHAKKPSEILSEMNRFLIRYIEYRFVSAVYIRIDYKKKIIEYCTAGHPPILLYHHNNSQIEVLGTENTLLGFREEIEYNMNSAQFENNDQLYLYTDGVYESLNPEMLKDGLNILKKKILNVIQSDPGNSPESIVNSMDSMRPVDDHKDDVTLIQVNL